MYVCEWCMQKAEGNTGYPSVGNRPTQREGKGEGGEERVGGRGGGEGEKREF